MNEFHCIYAITNLSDGKRYIGSTANWPKRRSAHLCNLRAGKHANKRLQRAWNKHGESKFAIGIISRVPLNSDLLQAEQAWLGSYGPEYNLAVVAGCPATGLPMSEESRRKIGDTWRGKKFSKVHRDRISKSNTGKRPSEESKNKMRLAKLGKKLSPSHVEKAKNKLIQSWSEGGSRRISYNEKKASGTLPKITSNRKGKKLSPSHGLAVAEANRRNNVTLERRARVSAGHKKSWAKGGSRRTACDARRAAAALSA